MMPQLYNRYLVFLNSSWRIPVRGEINDIIWFLQLCFVTNQKYRVLIFLIVPTKESVRDFRHFVSCESPG